MEIYRPENETTNPLDFYPGVDEGLLKMADLVGSVLGHDAYMQLQMLLTSMQSAETQEQRSEAFSLIAKDEQMRDLNVSALSTGVRQWLPLINEICAGYPEVPSDIMARLVQKESRGDRMARPMRLNRRTGQMEVRSSARGLTQIMDKTLITFLGRDLRRRGVRGISFNEDTRLSEAKAIYFRHTGLTEADIDRFDPRFNLEVTAQNLTLGLQKEFFRTRLEQYPERRGFYTYLIHHDGAGGAEKTVEFLEHANGNFTEEFWTQNRSMIPSFHNSFEQTQTVVNFALCVNGPATDESLQRLTNTRVRVQLESDTQVSLNKEEYIEQSPTELNQEPRFWIENFNIIGDSNALGLTNVAHRTRIENENELSASGARSKTILETKADNLADKPTTVVCCGYNDMNALGANPSQQAIEDKANNYISLIDAVYNKALENGTKVIVMIPHTFIPKGSQATEESQHKFQNKLKELINAKGYNPSVLRVIDNSPLRDILHPHADVKRAWMARIQQLHFELNPELNRSSEVSEDSAPEAPAETQEETSSGEGGATGGSSDDSGTGGSTGGDSSDSGSGGSTGGGADSSGAGGTGSDSE